MIASFFRLLAVAVLVVCLIGKSPAQVFEGKQIVRAELFSDVQDASKPFTVAIRFVIEPGWYLYWKNPGDGGLPPNATWDLPEGFTASELQFPTPEKFVYDNVVAYGYKNELILLATITPNTSLSSLPSISAKLDWLVCKESCIRGSAPLSMGKLSETERSKAAAFIAKTRSSLPLSLNVLGVSVARASLSEMSAGIMMNVEFQGKNIDLLTDFFPESSDNLSVDFQTIRVEKGLLKMVLTPFSKDSKIKELRGLMIADGKGYECVIRVDSKTM
jgi:DsbC/DsbD-like thiol-disulfide interchange protein